MLSEAKKKSNAKWNKAHYNDYERILVMIPRSEFGIKDKVKAKADRLGISVSDYVRRLMAEDLAKED